MAFVFIMPLKFGLVNLDTLHPQISNTIIFIDPLEQWPEELAQMCILVLVILWGARSISEKKIALRYSRADIFLWGFMAAVVISTVGSSVKHSSLVGLRQFAGYLLLYYFLLNNFTSSVRRERLLEVFLIAVGVIAAAGVYQYLYDFDRMSAEIPRLAPKNLQSPLLARIAGRRVFSTFVYPNVFAGFLLMAIPICVSFATYQGRRLRPGGTKWKFILAVVLVVATFICFFLAGSKGGYLCLAVSVTLGLIIFRRWWNLKWRCLVVVFVALAAMGIAFLHTPKGAAMLRHGRFTFSERFSYWRAGVRMIERAPIFGSGLNTFKDLYPIYKDPLATPSKSAHNNYLQLMVETGVVGATFFILFWLGMVVAAGKKIISGWRTEKKIDTSRMILVGCFLGLVGFMLHNVVDFDLYVPSIAMSAWFFAALALPESGLIRIRNFDLSSSARQLTVFVIILAVCGGGIYCTSRLFHGRVYFSSGEDILYGRAEGSELQAIEEIEHGLRLDPLNQNYHLLLGQLHFRQNRYIKAIESLKKAHELDPLSHQIRFKLAMAEFRYAEMIHRLDWDRFFEDMEATIRLFPTSSFYRFIYAYHLDQAGRLEAACTQLMTALVLDPGLEKTLHTIETNYNDPEVTAAAGAVRALVRMAPLPPTRIF